MKNRHSPVGQVLFLSQYFPPEKARVVTAIAASLKKHNESTQVLTGFPNYPTGKLYPGYRQELGFREIQNGLRVQRVPLFPDHSERAFFRILNYLSFALTSTVFGSRTGKAADVVYVYATQMTAAMGPWLWRVFGNTPYLLHIQDLWPDSVVGSSISGSTRTAHLIESLLNPWLKSVYRRAGHIIVISPGMKQLLVNRGVESDKISVVYNCGPVVQAAHQPIDRNIGEPVRILYAGNIGEMQALEDLVAAAARFDKQELVLTIVGEGSRRASLEEMLDRLSIDNVSFRPGVSEKEVGAFYETHHFSAVTLKDLPVFRATVPSKFQASLAYGLPVVTTVDGDLSKMVQAHEIGFTASPGDVESLTAALRRAVEQTPREYAEMKASAHKLYDQLFTETSMAERILDALKKTRKVR